MSRHAGRTNTSRQAGRLLAPLMVALVAVAAAGAALHASAETATGTSGARSLRMVSNGYYAGAQFDGATADGRRIVFETSAPMLPADTDSGSDVYRDDAGQVDLMSPSGPFDGAHSLFAGMSADGSTVVFTGFDALTVADVDPGPDLYVFMIGTPGPTLVTPGPGYGTFRAVSDDGRRVLFDSTTSFSAADTDGALDLYLWDDGDLRLVSGATPNGQTAAADGLILGVANDVQTVLFGEAAALVGGAPAGGATYEWHASNGSLTVRVADPQIGGAQLSPDGSALTFWSAKALVGGDTNGTADVYLEDGSLHLLTDGTTVDAQGGPDGLIVGYDTWVLLETSEALVAGDTDGHVDVYRWTKSTGAYALVTPGSGPIDAWFQGGTASGPVVVQTTEALATADVDSAPDLYLIQVGDPVVHLVTSPTLNEQAVFAAVSVLGDRVLYSSPAALDPADVDSAKQDVFEYRLAGASIESVAGPGSTRDVFYRAASSDAKTVMFTTGSALLAADTDPSSNDIYVSVADATPPDTVVSQVLPLITPGTTATVTFTSSDASRFECRLDGGPWTGCTSPLHLTGLGEGSHTVDVRAWNVAGQVDPTPGSQSWVVDLTGPTGSVSINGGASIAGRTVVRVAVPASDLHGISVVLLSSSPATTPTCGGGCPVLNAGYQVTDPGSSGPGIPFDVARTDYGGVDADGPHTVYVQWQDGVGNWSAVASDTIVVDRSVKVATSVHVRSLTNPVGSGGSSFLEATVIAADGTPVDTGTVQFSGAGVTSIAYPVGGGVANHWQTGWTAGAHVVTATYSGAADLTGSVGAVTQYVGVDAVAPSVSGPAARIAGGVANSPTIPIRLTWSGTDPAPGFGVVRFELRQSTDGGAAVPVSATLTTPAVTRLLAQNHTYRFVVRAFDAAGNVSAWAWGPSFRLAVGTESSSALTYRGTWSLGRASTFYGGAVRSASARGATATYRFVGREIAWMTTLGPTRGVAVISVDGVVVKTIDLFRATTQTRSIVYDRLWSTAGTHSITVRVVGTAGRPRVDIDAFVWRR